MIQRPETLEHLLKLSNSPLAAGERDGAAVAQFVANAESMLADAQSVAAAHSSFTLAYEGVHSLAMALLNHFSVRPRGGDGHRSMALQFFIEQAGLREKLPGAYQAVTRAHERRNSTSYTRPVPPISAAEAQSMVTVLATALPSVKAIVEKV